MCIRDRAIDDVTGERVTLISQDQAREMRSASLIAAKVPVAQLEPIGVEFFTLQPGEQAVVPVVWRNGINLKDIIECSTHPEAPNGLRVEPGTCPQKEHMSLIMSNESELAITVTEDDVLAVGLPEDDVPDLETCMTTGTQRHAFYEGLDWTLHGDAKDVIREVPSPKPDRSIVVVVHHVPRYSSCNQSELGEPWSKKKLASRITTCTYQSGEIDYFEDNFEEPQTISQQLREEPFSGSRRLWCGQTVFTFVRDPDETTASQQLDPDSQLMQPRMKELEKEDKWPEPPPAAMPQRVRRKKKAKDFAFTIRHPHLYESCLLYTSPSPRDRTRSRMPSSA